MHIWVVKCLVSYAVNKTENTIMYGILIPGPVQMSQKQMAWDNQCYLKVFCSRPDLMLSFSSLRASIPPADISINHGKMGVMKMELWQSLDAIKVER